MKVTEADMESRKRMIELRASINDAIARHEGVTYGELLTVLAQATATWAQYLRREELDEKGEGDR